MNSAPQPQMFSLQGRRGLVLGIANEESVATGCARAFAHFANLLTTAARESPSGRLATIEDCGGLAAFLVSDAAQMLTGTIIPVDGGQHLLA